MKKDLFDFLKSDRKIEIFNTKIDRKILITKVKCNDKIEILYAIEDYKGELFDLSSSFKYIGIYNNENNKLYDIDFLIFNNYLKLHYKEEEILTKDKLYKIIEKEVNEEIRRIVNRNKEKILNAYKIKSNMGIQEDEVLDAFIKGIPSEELEDPYNQYYADKPKMIISYLTDKDAFLKEETKNFIMNHTNSIIRGIFIGKKMKEILKKIEDNKEHPYYKIKKIIDILKDNKCVTVNLTINKDGIKQTFKYNVDKLKNCYGFACLPSYGFEKKNERDLFEKNYGIMGRFYYYDIEKITYGKKVIYEDENLKEKVDEKEL